MVIRKPVYEMLPYAYLLIGVLVIMLLESPLALISGVLFYAAGAAVWVMRSTYRRRNSEQKITNRRGRFIFPRWIYEYLPFVYIGFGVLLFALFSSALAYVPAAILCIAGSLVWMIRAIYRSQLAYEALG